MKETGTMKRWVGIVMILYDSGWIDRWANLFLVYISATDQIDEVMLLTALLSSSS